MDAEPHYTLPAGDPIVVARFRLDDGSLDQAGDAAGLQSGAENGVVRFVVAADGRFDDLLSDVDLHSSARFMLPTFDFDTDRAFDIGVGFYFGESPLVVIMADEPLPIYDVVMAIVYEAIDDLSRDENVEDLYTAARAVRWCVPRRLRQRIRDIEESVRDALDDEHMSANDYTALREYAVRLARVARLASGLRAPTFQGYKPQGRYSGLIDLPGPDVPKNLRDVGDEARESEARLSGLISSQQIVLQQRQAADTERFSACSRSLVPQSLCRASWLPYSERT